MVVRWTKIAEERLKNIFDYYLDVAGHKVAIKIVTKIVDSSDSLGVMPFMAPIDNDLIEGKEVYRSMTINRMFKIVYFVDEISECVVIFTIWDCRRNPLWLKKDVHNS